jgi:hypothetical protein
MDVKAEILAHGFLGATRSDNRAMDILAENMATISVSCAAYSNWERN